jgi:hypothetical protein
MNATADMVCEHGRNRDGVLRPAQFPAVLGVPNRGLFPAGHSRRGGEGVKIDRHAAADVVVVGFGPVGATLAVLLAQHGWWIAETFACSPDLCRPVTPSIAAFSPAAAGSSLTPPAVTNPRKPRKASA